MSGFTKGEWKAERQTDGKWEIVRNAHPLTYIAILYDGIPDEEQLANARLIAAAPKLLDALAGAIETAENEGMQDAWWYAEARAVIAEVEKGQNYRP